MSKKEESLQIQSLKMSRCHRSLLTNLRNNIEMKFVIQIYTFKLSI